VQNPTAVLANMEIRVGLHRDNFFLLRE